MKSWLLLPLILNLAVLPAVAESPEEKGLAIAVEADKRDSGWQDHQANMVMTLRNKQGQESRRTIRIKDLEVAGDGDRSLSIFDDPRDVKGTAFLSFTHALEADDQWLYLPALKRVKRISSANKSGPFMGSEFAYEDLSSQEVQKYSYKWLRDEVLDGHDSFVVERYPVYEDSGYTRQILWIDKAMYQAWKIEFYDRKDSLLKILEFSDYQQYLDKYWRPQKMLVTNQQNGKSTQLDWSDRQFATGLSDRDFDKNSLQRAR